MSTGAIIGIVIVVIVIVAIAVVASGTMRRARLRRQFGPEYDRLAKQLGSRKKADAELAGRQRRVEALGIHELSPEQQASYSGDWATVQERFVDTPAEAVAAADTLIWGVMQDRGYPANDRNASMDALSVYHPQALVGYRQTVDLRTEQATTEQLREAMIRYRALFEDLTGLRDGQDERGDRVAAIRDRGAGTNAAAADNHAAVADNRVADNRGRVAENDELTAENRDRAAQSGELGARAAQNSELAAENANRPADTPR
jgi:hypothetical protein